MNPFMTERIHRLRRTLRAFDCFLVTNISNVRYLTGFTGSSGIVLITKDKGILLTDFRYKEQAGQEAGGLDIVISKKDWIKAVEGLAKKLGIKRLGFEATVSYDFFKRLSGGGLGLIARKGLVEKLRAVKDSSEIEAIKEAVRRAEAAFLKVRPYIKAGISERSIALRLEERLKAEGCRRMPFGIIVASGPNSSRPHAGITERRLSRGDLVVIDWGGEAYGYVSDITRTFIVKGGSGGAKKKEIYGLVLEANKRAISSVFDGAMAKDIDNSARYVIKNGGYGEFFGHGTGHGVGLDVHELPKISFTSKGRVREDMVFTIEPGIYLPGLGGVRIEDMVQVCGRGARLLSALPKGLRYNLIN
jgi:Xaa-Pro aminopeptidase